MSDMWHGMSCKVKARDQDGWYIRTNEGTKP